MPFMAIKQSYLSCLASSHFLGASLSLLDDYYKLENLVFLPSSSSQAAGRFAYYFGYFAFFLFCLISFIFS